MHARVTGATVLIVVGMAALMVFVTASGSVAAAPLPAASTAVGTWSYGAVRTLSVGPLQSANGWTYEGNATFGYTVTIYENNTSANTFELTIFRTMGAAFSVRFCLSSCASPTEWVNESYRAWEATTAYSNFTSAGSVLEGGSPVPAIAIENSTLFLKANLTEASDVYLPLEGQLGPHKHYLSGEINGGSTVSFSPALGLVPTDLTPGSSWTSSSEYTAAGSAERTYFYAASAPLHSVTVGPVTNLVDLNGSGPVSLSGAYPLGSSFTFDGTTYPAISISVTGPFGVREGVVFVPYQVDLFGGASQPWASQQNGTATAQLSALDLRSSEGDRLAVVASSWQFNSGSANAGTSTTAVPASSELTAATVSSNPVSSTTIQGQPESASEATGNGQCLTTGAGCPSVPTATPASKLLGFVVVAGAVATVGALLALAVVTRRRRLPPPSYPNAVLYPPGSARPVTPASAPGQPAPPPPEDDPLSHLW